MKRILRWAWLSAGLASVTLATLISAKTPVYVGNEKIERYQKIRPELVPLIKGTRQVQDSDKKNIELAAEVLVWRVCSPVINTNAKIMDQVRKQFDQEMLELMSPPNRIKNKDFRKLLVKDLVRCFKDVFNLPFDETNRVGCVNAALLLPKLARTQEPEVEDLLIGLVKDPKMHDTVKHYALQGLAAFFPASEWTVVAPPNGNQASKKRDIERIKVVTDYLERKWDSSKADDAAVRFLRREAIKTLAQAQVPAVKVEKDEVVAPVATVFLQILDPKSTMKPSPSLQEKLEAAIGICQIKVIPNTLYLPDWGIYRVGTFLVDFANAYKKDHQNGNVGKVGRISLIPWKIQADRLQQALKLQVKNTEISDDYRKKAQDLLNAAQPYLNTMKSHLQIDNPSELGGVVSGMQPKTAEIYKGIKPDDGK